MQKLQAKHRPCLRRNGLQSETVRLVDCNLTFMLWFLALRGEGDSVRWFQGKFTWGTSQGSRRCPRWWDSRASSPRWSIMTWTVRRPTWAYTTSANLSCGRWWHRPRSGWADRAAVAPGAFFEGSCFPQSHLGWNRWDHVAVPELLASFCWLCTCGDLSETETIPGTESHSTAPLCVRRGLRLLCWSLSPPPSPCLLLSKLHTFWRFFSHLN